MLSAVCVYNNQKTLNEYLLRSLETQTSKYELILVDNTRGRYRSAAEALNWGGKRAKGKYVMFVHQDVDLCSNSWLEEAEKILDSLPDLGIAGVAGKREDVKGVMTISQHGDPPKLAGGIYIEKIVEVQTLDECLVIIPKSVFHTLQFDGEVCNNWHLYAVEYCLSARESGFGVYTIPMFIYHKSTGASTKNRFQTILSLGSLPGEYYQTLGKLLKKHKDYIRRVYTTCGDWNTSYPLILQRIGTVVKGGVKLLLRKGGKE